MCVRSQHLTLSGASPNYYAFPFAIGNLLPDWTNYYEGMRMDVWFFLEKTSFTYHVESSPGVLFTEYESGPWLALKSKSLPGTSLRWVGLGEASPVFPGPAIIILSKSILC